MPAVLVRGPARPATNAHGALPRWLRQRLMRWTSWRDCGERSIGPDGSRLTSERITSAPGLALQLFWNRRDAGEQSGADRGASHRPSHRRLPVNHLSVVAAPPRPRSGNRAPVAGFGYGVGQRSSSALMSCRSRFIGPNGLPPPAQPAAPGGGPRNALGSRRSRDPVSS